MTTVDLELSRSSLFFLAGYQCYLWTAIMGSIMWKGVWSAPDSDDLHIARETVFQPGDALPILVRGQKTISGFVILRERSSDSVFAASLCLLGNSDSVSKGTSLMTASASEIEGVINRFESPFAWIR